MSENAATEDSSADDRVELLRPPRTVNVQFGSAWNVVTPSVYRYEDQRWIDEFFDTGKLRLSTFSRFSKYPDEFRGDKHEGFGISYGETEQNTSLLVAHSQGANALVLCCSHKLSAALRDSFERDSAFQIMDTLGFGLEISRQLPGFRHGLEGSCIYRDKRSISRKIEFDLEKYKQPDGSLSMNMLFDTGAMLGGPELVLLKTLAYREQQEYRIIWELDTLSVEYFDIVCPLARQYCRRVKHSEFH